ncbi:MAG TPA: aromatic ring-hydroxylating dioxygenase subunit alpha [Verrucomicrobiae bacterium]|nr:aromatic ring-hydroxylating dioxygenase subunit alpha [Verrucomicrobiae bacterium]
MAGTVSSPSRAPVDPAELARTLAPLGQAHILPRAAYIDPGVAAWELEHFFDATWVVVGRSQAIASGSQRAVRAGTEQVLLTRDADGQLHAFFDVCRHRGHELLPVGAEVRKRAIKCPYHAWAYGLDGSLRAAPRFDGGRDFDPGQFGLVPIRMQEWHGWIFVNPDGHAEPLDQYLGNLGELVQDWEPERLVVAERHDYEVAANWKLIVENYHECYHCPSIHPELCRVSPPDSSRDLVAQGMFAGGPMLLMDHAETMSLDGRSLGRPLPRLDPQRLREVHYFGVFPNLLISLHPDYVMTHRLEPLGPGRSRIECEWLFAPEAIATQGFSPTYAAEFWDITNREDWDACEAVQRGVSSRGFRPGPLAGRESTVYQFDTMIARGYLLGRVHPPEPVDPPGEARPG